LLDIFAVPNSVAMTGRVAAGVRYAVALFESLNRVGVGYIAIAPPVTGLAT